MKQLVKIILILLLFVNFSFSQNDVFAIARTGTVEEMKVLYTQNKNCVNEVTSSGFSTLILASYRGNFEVAKYLVNIVQDIDYQSPEGTALMAAVMRDNISLIEILLEKKANIDKTNHSGVTALMLAIQFQKVEIIKILLQNNANKFLKDKEGKTAFEYAINTNNEAIINLLKN